jgi:hypothetical protein
MAMTFIYKVTHESSRTFLLFRSKRDQTGKKRSVKIGPLKLEVIGQSESDRDLKWMENRCNASMVQKGFEPLHKGGQIFKRIKRPQERRQREVNALK